MTAEAPRLLTTADLQKAFGVTAMTIHNWRKGTPQRPALKTKSDGRRVAFAEAAVRRWAEKAGVAVVDESALLGGLARGKPGPKPAPKPE
jgi:hypothetical protein